MSAFHGCSSAFCSFLQVEPYVYAGRYDIHLQALQGEVREKVQLATKFGIVANPSKKREIRGDPAYVREACEASLKRLGVDCIDLYYQRRIDTTIPIEVTDLPRFQPENVKKNGEIFERVNEMAAKKGCTPTPSQLALAWVLYQGSDVCPIPGTTKFENFNNNVAALSVKLTQEDMAELESYASGDIVGDRYHEFLNTWKDSETPPLSSWKAE
ncbi:hypothetical protein PR202_gb26030 [Eleusine coracana subsp. coracana]|uniref:NADP-dependent oxidoreductase domain-containing protein n=1 Tax=Eleusine coracana subsp. coracana TaxID=191504 RepID=A0AAV5FQ52_ELECO|nr:hypothetical protein PR202_gb26030 [Eleusine coracana subsp. coracana]